MGAQWKAKGKAQAADAGGKLFGRLAKDIMIAARNGADPSANSRQRLVVEQARKMSIPMETLERAIKKGAGLLGDAVSFEPVIYEGFAPHQVPVMIELLTDNVNRSASEIRVGPVHEPPGQHRRHPHPHTNPDQPPGQHHASPA